MVSVAAPCRDVKAEMIARIGAQSDATWIDPHNAGTYSIIDDERESVLSTQRKTGDGFFTDAISFSFDAVRFVGLLGHRPRMEPRAMPRPPNGWLRARGPAISCSFYGCHSSAACASCTR